MQKIAYALAQILQSEDSSEVTAVHNSIASLYQIDPIGNYNGNTISMWNN